MNFNIFIVSIVIDMGFDIIEILKYLKHESAKATLDIYYYLYPDKDQKLHTVLNKL